MLLLMMRREEKEEETRGGGGIYAKSWRLCKEGEASSMARFVGGDSPGDKEPSGQLHINTSLPSAAMYHSTTNTIQITPKAYHKIHFHPRRNSVHPDDASLLPSTSAALLLNGRVRRLFAYYSPEYQGCGASSLLYLFNWLA